MKLSTFDPLGDDKATTTERELLMDLQLTNKKALVTGSTAGISFAIASLLAQEGASVVVNGARKVGSRMPSTASGERTRTPR